VKPLISLRQALTDPRLLAPVMGGPTRAPMRALLLASQGEELTDSELEHFSALTGREAPPNDRVEEMHVIAGRRAGKSSGVAGLAVYLSALCDYSDRLSPGERGVILLVAENQRQARVLLGYIAGAFEASPALRRLVTNRTATTLSLSNGVDVEVRSADFRALRGLTLICAIADEISFWRSEDSTNPDFEIVDAIRPGLATTRGQLFTIGSPYAKRGVAYQTFVKHYGAAGDPRLIVAKGATRQFNETVPQEIIDRAIERDPQSAASEWLGEFRNDIDAFVNADIVAAAVFPGRHELMPLDDISYAAFCDAAGGSGTDSFTLCIAHRSEDDVGVVDCIREYRPPFSPANVVKEIAMILESYQIDTINGDRYAGSWPAERFNECGIRYEPSERSKSQIYVDALPLLNSGKVELLDNRKLVSQLCSLERRVGRGTGRDSIDHPVGGHDDIANAVCGALVLVANSMDRRRMWELL
jgi:hypothetical protein